MPVVDIQAITRIAATDRMEGRRIVFTNGCFDVLHSAHLTTLEHAKTLGDSLIVGVNTDASVGRLKGPTRPVNRQDDRARLVAALRCVDHVVIFDDDTPDAILSIVRPDVLVKGGDYAGQTVHGSEHAGEVVLSPLVDGLSTTMILERIAVASLPSFLD